ncbi:hypothetical protein FQN50_006364 [Emmonsiellopsis sp. PD_5]|nr:hypothetical protein FQN50_006364 [Emmonsiellopsis sp. PD_5]
MSRVSAEEQFSFLISCVKHSNNGKVDFTEVAKDCNIVTKGAAAKRYERMMKANGINPNGGSPIPYTTDTDNPQDANGTTTTPKTPKTPKTPRSKAGAGTKTPTSRKRKGGAAAAAASAKENEGSPKKIKSEPIASSDDGGSQVMVKVESKEEEGGVVVGNGNGTDGMMMTTADDPFFSQEIDVGREEREMYSAFCDSGAKVGAGGLYAGAGGSGEDGENQDSYMDGGEGGEILNMFQREDEF